MHMKTRFAKPAFTFVEIVIVILLIAIFASGFALSYENSREKVTFDSDQQRVLSIIQKARNLSLTNLEVNDKQADYYHLAIATSGITLTGYDIDGGTSAIDSVTFSTGIISDRSFSVDYAPPYGEVTINSGGPTFIMSDTNGNTSTIRISPNGGFADVS